MDFKKAFKQQISFQTCSAATIRLIKKNVLSQGFKGDKKTLELICVEMGLQPTNKQSIKKIKNVFIKNKVSSYHSIYMFFICSTLNFKWYE